MFDATPDNIDICIFNIYMCFVRHEKCQKEFHFECLHSELNFSNTCQIKQRNELQTVDKRFREACKRPYETLGILPTVELLFVFEILLVTWYKRWKKFVLRLLLSDSHVQLDFVLAGIVNTFPHSIFFFWHKVDAYNFFP